MVATQKGKSKGTEDEFGFLLELGKSLGATDAKVVTSDKIVVEDRVVFKCKSGCHWYGEKFTCPPFTPTPDEFRKVLKDYKYVLVVKFPSKAEAEEDVGRNLLRNQFDPDVCPEVKERTNKFWNAWAEDKRQFLLRMLELEKAAFNRGYTLAVALMPGSCSLCKSCNIKKGTCVHPSMARYSPHALGIYEKKTLENVGISIQFPFQRNPEGVGILLID